MIAGVRGGRGDLARVVGAGGERWSDVGYMVIFTGRWWIECEPGFEDDSQGWG